MAVVVVIKKQGARGKGQETREKKRKMSGNGNYKNLIVWQKSIILVKKIYKVSGSFPSEEKFGLISQMRRAVVSIPSNIAEGQAKRTTKDYIRFVSIAEGSLAELETQLIIAVELDFCSKSAVDDCFSLMLEIRKMLNALRLSLTRKLR